MNELRQTINSLEIARMVGRTHDNVLKDIRNIIQQIGSVKTNESYFIETTYKNSQNKELPCFDCTKKGCELYSTRMTGAKGTQFAVAYIERFNNMEEHIKEKQLKLLDSPRETLRLMFEFQEDVADRVEAVESDVKYIKDNQLLTEQDYSTISSMVRRKIGLICTQQHLNSKAKTELFKDLNSSIKRITGAAARNRIKAKQFDEVVKFINNWMPSTATMTIIDQMDLLEDE